MRNSLGLQDNELIRESEEYIRDHRIMEIFEVI